MFWRLLPKMTIDLVAVLVQPRVDEACERELVRTVVTS